MILSKERLLKALEITKKLLFITNVLVQSVFLVFYVYSIINNVLNLPFLIIYSILFLITATNFVRFLIVNIKHAAKPKIFYRVIRISKYATNLSLLGVNVYELIFLGAFLFDIVLLLSSAISLFIHVVIEIIRIVLEKRVVELGHTIADKINVQKRKEQFKEAKSNFYKSVDKPLQSISNRLDGKNQTENVQTQLPEQDLIVENTTTDALNQTNITKEEQIEIEKKNIAQHFNNIKEHIFHKKPQSENQPATLQLTEQENKPEEKTAVQSADTGVKKSKTNEILDRLNSLKNRFIKK